MTDLPAMIDVRDNLAYARRATDDDDVAASIDTVDDRLETFAARDEAGQQDILDEVENELLGLEERTDGETARRLRASRNRVRLYRDARADAADTVVPVESKVGLPADASTLADATPVGGEAAFRLTVVNEGKTREFDVVIAFEDDGDVVELVEADGGTVASNDEVTVTVETAIPDTATSYEVWARAAERTDG